MGQIYIALDTETTGAGAENHDIIEIAAIKFRDERVLDRWHSLVKPATPITYKVAQLTGITQQEVERAPLIHALAPQVLRFVEDLPVVGHSIEFDLQALASGGIRLRGPSYDTFELATLMLPETTVYTLARVAATLGIPHPDAHRAMADAEVTMQVFRILLARIEDLPLAALAEISRASANVGGHGGWAMRSLFQEAEREKTRTAFSLPRASIGDALLAKGVGAEALELNMLRAPTMPPPLEMTPIAVAVDVQAVAESLAPDGVVARVTEGYEHRPQQIQMAEAVARALNEGGQLLVEAGTGTGKSMAYLLPAIDFAVHNGQRVVISTNTINLQEQLYFKDIPALQRALAGRYEAVQAGGRDKGRKKRRTEQDEPFVAAMVKGRSNYLCLRRWATFRKSGNLNKDEIKLLVKGLVWLPITDTGDRAELLLLGNEYAAWERVCAQSEACDLSECPVATNGLCFLHRAREQAEAAHIVVVNHALLLADLATDNALLPEYDHLIIDEAHHLEDVATEQLGYKVSERMICDHLDGLSHKSSPRSGVGSEQPQGLMADLRAMVKLLPKDKQPLVDNNAARVQEKVAEANNLCDALFECLGGFFSTHFKENGQYDNRLRLTDEVRHQPAWEEVVNAWTPLAVRLMAVQDGLDILLTALAGNGLDERMVAELKMYAQANRDLRTHIEAIISDGHADEIYWLQSSARDTALSMHAAPLHVGSILADKLFANKQTVVLSSATLATNGNFSYIKERLGLDAYQPQELIVGSPFDYQHAALIYLPTDMPEPNQPGYQKALDQAIIDLSIAADGRTLVLFTSTSALRATYKAIQHKLESQGIMVLGHNVDGGNRRQLLDRFKGNPRSVLLGTNSFWEGVDVVGDNLSVLVIAKLPFSVPNDPIVAARSEQFDDAFNNYSVPQAVLKLKQGFGRLIRSRTDRGVVALLDRRLMTKGYGATFLNSLPPAKVEHGLTANMAARARAWLTEG